MEGRDGVPWSPFGIYSARVIINELRKIPKTAVRVKLPERLEGIVGEFYRLDAKDRAYIQASTTGRFIYYVEMEAKRIKHELRR